MREDYGEVPRMVVTDEYGNIPNEQILIVAGTGGGKSLMAEELAEKLHSKGYVVIFLTNVKEEKIEAAFAMFEPKERYHLESLAKQGKEIKTKNVKIYHPLTTKIPNHQLPEIEFYSIPLKNLGTDHISYLIESDSETDDVKAVRNAVEDLSDNDTIYDLIQYVQERMKIKTKRVAGKDVVMYDPYNMFAESSGGGSRKTVGEIVSYFKPYENSYFITPKTFPYVLDVKNILNDRENYHVFTSFLEKDNKKAKDFSTLCVMEEIFRNIGSAKYPVLLVIEEVGNICPQKTSGYKVFLANYVRFRLTSQRAGGRGISSILTAQIYSGDAGVDEKVRESVSQTFIGRMSGIKDIENLSKALKWRREDVQRHQELERGQFLRRGFEESGAWRTFFTAHCHAEEKYNFFEMYEEKFPEKMRKYTDIRTVLLKHIKETKERIEAKLKEKKKKEIEDIEKEVEKIEAGSKTRQELEIVKGKRRKEVDKARQEKMDIAYRTFMEALAAGKAKSIREVAATIKVSKDTAGKYLVEMLDKKHREAGTPISPQWIAEQLGMKLKKVQDYLKESQSGEASPAKSSAP